MRVFTAERSNGDVYVVAGRAGLDRDGFTDFVLTFLRTLPDDEATPRTLELYEWDDVEQAGAWMGGCQPPAGQSWTQMRRAACFGEIGLEYVGDGVSDWFVKTAAI